MSPAAGSRSRTRSASRSGSSTAAPTRARRDAGVGRDLLRREDDGVDRHGAVEPHELPAPGRRRARSTRRRARRHRGRTSWVWEVEFTDDQGRLCAISRVTMAVRPVPDRLGTARSLRGSCAAFGRVAVGDRQPPVAAEGLGGDAHSRAAPGGACTRRGRPAGSRARPPPRAAARDQLAASRSRST